MFLVTDFMVTLQLSQKNRSYFQSVNKEEMKHFFVVYCIKSNLTYSKIFLTYDGKIVFFAGSSILLHLLM